MLADSGVRNHLKAIRTRLGLSQADVALAAGVTRQTIGGIEGGLYAPSAAVALRIARALGCRVEDVFWLEDAFPSMAVAMAGDVAPDQSVRVALAHVGGQWIAHPLAGQDAFRLEMVPCDGIGRFDRNANSWFVDPVDDPASLTRTVVLAGCSPVLSLWARAAERWHPGLRVHWIFANSTTALDRLLRGDVHGAGIHVADPETGEYNVPFIRRHAPRQPITLINLGVWEEGLLVQPGNPKRITTGADLARPGVRIINREAGAGSRILLDETLQAAGVAAESIPGYDAIAYNHVSVAEVVAAGRVDAGVSSASIAATFGLDFVPLREARYDLAFYTDTLQHEPVRQLLSTLSHRWVRSQFAILGGYNTARTGEVIAEIP